MKLKDIVRDYHSFHEANKNWLVKFDNTEYREDYDLSSPPSYWTGEGEKWHSSQNFSIVPWLTGHTSGSSVFLSFKNERYSFVKLGSCIICDSYFLDWKNPTKEENDYFGMIYGFRIPWGEGLIYKDYGDEYEINKASSVVEDKP